MTHTEAYKKKWRQTAVENSVSSGIAERGAKH